MSGPALSVIPILQSASLVANPNHSTHSRVECANIRVHPGRVETHAIATAMGRVDGLPFTLQARNGMSPIPGMLPLDRHSHPDAHIIRIKIIIANLDPRGPIIGSGRSRRENNGRSSKSSKSWAHAWRQRGRCYG